jgi:DNA replication protein
MGNFTWPKHLAEKFRALPTDPQEVTWECATCGTIEPQKFDVDGVAHYNRRLMCPCQQKEKERKEKEEQRKVWIEMQAARIYSWLGDRWSDPSLAKKTFENFKPDTQTEAYEAARLYAANPSGTLVLYGTFGTGKTHLLAAVCNEALYKHGVSSRFTTAPELFGAIQQKIAHNEDYYALVEGAAKIPLFVIDDIDKSKWTEFREEIYFAIIDRRSKRGLPTAISTNRLDQLADFVGGAVCSRLKLGQIAIPMNGVDYREEL